MDTMPYGPLLAVATLLVPGIILLIATLIIRKK